ncbi:MAG: FeoA family protein [candidate division WOR-3 bacterium]
MKVIPLINLASNETGVIVDIVGGRGVVSRLMALGIRPGKKITKKSAMIMRGPIVIQVDSTEIALGYGIAQKILVRKE